MALGSLLLFTFAAILVPGFLKEFVVELGRLIAQKHNIGTFFILGFVVNAPLHYFFAKGFTDIYTYFHELNHSAMATIFGNRITDFKVLNGGYMNYQGGVGGYFARKLILLAPYGIPFSSILVCFILYRFLEEKHQPNIYFISAFVGLLLGNHFVRSISDIANCIRSPTNQILGYTTKNDLHEFGLIRSLVVILFLQTAFYGFVIGCVNESLPGGFGFLKRAIETASLYFQIVSSKVAALL